MDRDDDVERLFSWIKTPDLHYREFAAEREVADAVVTWPVPRDAVAEPDHPGEPYEPEPARETEPPPAGRMPLGDRPSSLFGQREPAPEPPAFRPQEPSPLPLRPTAPEDAGEVPWAPEPPRPSPIFARLEPAPPPQPQPVPELPTEPPEDQYRGFEEPRNTSPAAEPAHAGEKRSLEAIFTRVAHPAPAPRDDRKRASAGPGLGSVFRRLR
jgi:hypothetical protein